MQSFTTQKGFYEWKHWDAWERSHYMSKSIHLHPASAAKTVVRWSNTQAEHVSSLRHPSLRIPPSLLCILWNLCHAFPFSVYKSQIASTLSLANGSGRENWAKRPGRARFSARPVNTLTVKHRGAVMVRGGSLTRPLWLISYYWWTDFMHPNGGRCRVESWPRSSPTHP